MTKNEWFIDWFDSPYYHLLYKNRDEREAENFVLNLIQRLQLKSDAKILDVACGTGRHAINFHKQGFDVTGIDLSKNSIAQALQHETKGLHFEQWDMRQVYRKDYFDVVVNLFSSFGYLPSDKDNLIAFEAIAANLKQQGKLVLDFLNVNLAIKQLKHKETIMRNHTEFHIHKFIEDGYILKNIQFNDENDIPHEYQEKLRIIHLNEFQELCQHAGLTIKSTWGDYQLNDYDITHSPRLILYCERK